MLTKEDFNDLWLPKNPLATFSFEAGLYRTSRKKAENLLFIENNVRTLKNLLVIDVDKDDSEWFIKEKVEEEGVLPEPNFITINPASDHAHVGYFLEYPCATKKTLQYFNDLHKKFNKGFGDARYIGLVHRNPTSIYQNTLWGTDHLYTLTELNKFVKSIKKDPKIYAPLNMYVDDDNSGYGRNSTIFDLTRKAAYKAFNRTFDNENYDWTDFIYDYSSDLNNALDYPLDLDELETIRNSVISWVGKHFDEDIFSKIQSKRARKRWGTPKIETILNLQESGLNMKEIANALNMSYDAVKKQIQRNKVS